MQKAEQVNQIMNDYERKEKPKKFVYQWQRVDLSKAERKGKSVEEIEDMRKRRWQAHQVCKQLGYNVALDMGIITKDMFFIEENYIKMMELQEEAKQKAKEQIASESQVEE
jgi:hypothetical protein